MVAVKIRMYFIVLLALCCFGCASENTLPAKPFKLQPSQSQLQGVNLVINKVDNATNDFSRYRYQYRLRLQDTIYRDLATPGAFTDISLFPGKYSYRLNVNYESKLLSNPYAYGGAGLVSAATIFVLPVPNTTKYILNVDVFYKNKKIKSYHYEDISKTMVNIVNQPPSIEEDELSRLINCFLSDLYNDNIIPLQNDKRVDE